MKKKENKQNEIQEGKPNRTDIRRGSATQGGSNFGQGSTQLGRYSNAQGSESNEGANYGNEQGWNNEALRMEDLEDTNKGDETDKE